MSDMAGDDLVLRQRIRRELAERPNTGPAWLTTLSQTETYRAVLMSHVLGDGNDIMLGARLPDGREFTCLVFIDHNVGNLVNDAFVISEPISTVVARSQERADDPDTRWEDISLADARSWVGAAIQRGAITIPPSESDTWPACRALVEWVIRWATRGRSRISTAAMGIGGYR